MPVIYSEAYGGHWFVSRYQDAFKVASDWETFSSAEGCLLPPSPNLLIPMEMDPPDHRKYRSILNPHFSPKQMPAHQGWIRDEAKKQTAQFAELDHFDLLEAFALPFPKTVAMRMLGFPDADLAILDGWITTLTVRRDEEATMQAGIALNEYLTEMVNRRSGQPPQSDLISVVLTGMVDEKSIPSEHQISMLMLLLFGGLHTTTSTLAGALVWLADHPEDRARLRKRPELMATAVEEFVRFISPANAMGRIATAETEIGGCPIKKGNRVVFGIGAANRDESEFDRPDDVDLAPYPNRHMGFGAGPHRCVGAHLAKVQLRVGIGVPQRFSGFRDRGPRHCEVGGRRSARPDPCADQGGQEVTAVGLSVAESSCQGHGRCYSRFPETFQPDDEGLAMVEVSVAQIGTPLEADFRLAAAGCPERAIIVTDGSRART